MQASFIELNDKFRETFYLRIRKASVGRDDPQRHSFVLSLTVRLLVGGPQAPLTMREFSPLLAAIHAGDGKRAASITSQTFGKNRQLSPPGTAGTIISVGSLVLAPSHFDT